MTSVFELLGQPGDRLVPEPYTVRFGIDDLREIRRITAGWAQRAGMAASRAADFVTAVNEIASNAVRFGSPTAELALRLTGRSGDDIAEAEVRDSGHWTLSVWAETVDGRGRLGLALARRICDEVQIETAVSGTTVIVRMGLTGGEAEKNGCPAD